MIHEILELRRWIKNLSRSKNEIKALQEQKLRIVVRNACENVPYYKSLFRTASLHSDDIETLDDLKKIPVTTKTDLLKAGEKRFSQTTSKQEIITKTTSGTTTAQPFPIELTSHENRVQRFMKFRALLDNGLRVRDRHVALGARMPDEKRLHQKMGFYRSINIACTTPMDRQIRLMRDFNPTVLWFYPTSLRHLIREIGKLSNLISPRMLISSGEVLDEVLKASILQDKGLRASLHNFYGFHEVGLVAAECHKHEGLHIASDHVVFECQEEATSMSPLPFGKAIVTNLDAFHMPLIRYVPGDFVGMKKSACSCGSPFPLIVDPCRESDPLRLPSGRILYPRGPLGLKSFPNILQFCMIQKTETHFVLKVAFKEEGKVSDQDLEDIQQKVMQTLGESIELEVFKSPYIRNAAHKFRVFCPL